MTTLVKADDTMTPAFAIVAPNSGSESSSDCQHARSTASITTGEQPTKAVPPKCAFVPGLIQSSTHSPRVKYHPPSSYTPTTPSMTARKPLCSSPLAGPPALFDTGSDSESDETENPSGPVLPDNSDPPSLAWNIHPALSPYSNFDLKPASPRDPRVRVRVPCPPPKCYLHPHNTAINNADNDSFTIHDLTRTELDTLLTRYKCTCNENDSNGRKNVLKKKRSSTSSPTLPTSPTPNSSAPRASMPLSSPAHSRDQKKSTEMNDVEKDTARSGPRPGMRSNEDIASEREMKISLFKGRELEAGLEGCRRGMINVAGGGLRDRVDPAGGVGSGAGVPIFHVVVDEEEEDGADGVGGVKESAGDLRRCIRPGELGYRGMGPGTLEGARRSEGRVLGGGRPISLHMVAEGESRRRRDEWETDSAPSSCSVRRHDDNRSMTTMELGMGSVEGSNRKRNVVEGPRAMSTLNEWEEFGVLKPPSQHLLSPLSAVSGAGKESSLDAMRRTMAHPFSTSRTTRVDSLSSSTSSVPSNLFNPPITPPSERFSMSTSSPLSSLSHFPQSLSSSVSSTTSRSPSSLTPRPKRTTPADNTWYTANPWGEIPKFTRLGLSAPGVVLPISAKEHMRLKRGHATSPTNRRWSNFPSSNSSSCSSRAHVSVSSSQEKDHQGTEANLEGGTLSRSSSASATTSGSSNSSACWSACTTSTTSPSPTSEEHDSMGRVLSLELVESVDDVALKSDSLAFETVKQTNHANKPHRRSFGIIKGLRGNNPARHPCAAGVVHPYASSELTLAMGNVGNVDVEATSSQSLVACKLKSPMGIDHTLSTPSLEQYPSSYSLSTSGLIGVGEGGKLRRGDSSVKRWWKSLVGGAR